MAAGCGNTAAALQLIEMGADANRANAQGFRALHFAAFSGDVAVCKALIDKGADLGAVDVVGDQAIDRAEVAGEDCRQVYLWMVGEMQRRNISRVYGNIYPNPRDMEAAQQELAAQDVTKEEREGQLVEDTRLRAASSQRTLRLQRCVGVMCFGGARVVRTCMLSMPGQSPYMYLRIYTYIFRCICICVSMYM